MFHHNIEQKDGEQLARQVRGFVLAPQAGRGGEVRARSWLASCFWCFWWWWSSSTVLLRPALVARGVVAVGAGVLVVVVRGDGGTAGCWAEVEDGAVAELFQRVQIPALAAGGSCGRSTKCGGAVFSPVRGTASLPSSRSFGRVQGSDRDLSW